MRKTFMLLLALTAVAGSVCAEQPKAEEYRAIFSSGTYYVEYKANGGRRGLAVKDGARMKYSVKTRAENFLAGGVFSLFKGGSSAEPLYLYADGKYYQYRTKKELQVATEANIRDKNLNPAEGWETARAALALPVALRMFAPDDPFNRYTDTKGSVFDHGSFYDKLFAPGAQSVHRSGQKIPQFRESGQKERKGKLVDYDKYVIEHKTKGGKLLYEDVFYLYYPEGELKTIEVYKHYPNTGEIYGAGVNELGEIRVNKISIKKITRELPKGAFELPSKCKLYAPGLGDMDDLLGNKVLIEEYCKPKEAK